MTDRDNLLPFHPPGPSSRSPRHPSQGEHPSSADAWDLDDGTEYSPDKFYTGSRDQDKESINIQVKIPKSIVTQIEHWLQSGKIKWYRVRGDFVRDALYHRVYYLNKEVLKDPILESSLRSILMQGDMERTVREMEDQDEIVKRSTEALDKAVKLEDFASLHAILEDAELRLEGLRAPYKERLAAILDQYRKVYGDL